jgi:hypothetical protein
VHVIRKRAGGLSGQISLAGLAVLLALPAGPAGADEKSPVKVEKVEYGGWKNNLKVSNGDAELIATLDVGPRIISYRLKDGKNVFKEFEDQLGKSGEKTWQIRGGHRFWVGPEDTTRTYAPDNAPVSWMQQKETGAIRLIQKADEYGMQKEIEVTLEPKGAGVSVIHRLKNCGEKSTELTPWALSVMAPGGVEVIPLPAKKPHPGAVTEKTKPSDYWPNQNLVMWPFFDFTDPRWTFGSRYITLRQSKRGPTKIGLMHREGWVGYLNKGTLFVKSVAVNEGKNYPDRGCNFETFSNEDMLEIETLGPLLKLAPGKTVVLQEHWNLHGDVEDFKNEDEIDKHILARVRVK